MRRTNLAQPGEGIFMGHLSAPSVSTRGHQGVGARVLAVVHGRRASVGSS